MISLRIPQEMTERTRKSEVLSAMTVLLITALILMQSSKI